MRCWKCIVCVIFKVQELKCIFYETYSMPLMFDVFFILIPLFSILHFHKKLKSIFLRLGLNRRKKGMTTKLKKHKILDSSFTTMCKKMNNETLYSKKLMQYCIIIIIVQSLSPVTDLVSKQWETLISYLVYNIILFDPL